MVTSAKLALVQGTHIGNTMTKSKSNTEPEVTTEEAPKNYQKTQLTLPPAVRKEFKRIESVKGRTVGEAIAERNALIIALRRAKWTLQAISEASGLTRERVRQVVRDTENVGTSEFVIPEPPLRAEHTPREYVEPDPVKLARMLELQKAAQAVRSNSPKFREEAEEYTRLLAETHLKDGVPLYRLSKRLSEDEEKYGKASHGALRFRLARYGYKRPKTGTSHVYATIKDENRTQ